MFKQPTIVLKHPKHQSSVEKPKPSKPRKNALWTVIDINFCSVDVLSIVVYRSVFLL